MKLKLTNYAWDIETKNKKDIQMSSIVDLDSILMFIPKYALGFGYRKPVLANDGSDLNDPTPAGARGERGGIMNLYDTAFSGYAALPVGYIAVMKNGNYVPFTDFETPYNSDKWSVYDNLSLEDTKQWMEIQKNKHILTTQCWTLSQIVLTWKLNTTRCIKNHTRKVLLKCSIWGLIIFNERLTIYKTNS